MQMAATQTVYDQSLVNTARHTLVSHQVLLKTAQQESPTDAHNFVSDWESL